ncbi:PIN domain-containing protein [Arthrobacter sp. LjRoot14]|uniref:PIN domain-containing protein n=1 Tax=Arthrobacter sp. LjRoot14 TaxID=3342265 RepID=UPI003ECDDB21
MITVVIDTNILKMSPYLTRPEWFSLSAHNANGKVRLLVPEVVVMEAVNVVPRDRVTQRDDFSKAKVGEFGLQDNVNEIVQTIQDRIDSYESALSKKLTELGVEVVPVPEVPHLEVARRASRTIAPYKAKATKDNYRDTLIWLTLIDVATRHSTDEVWFVSDNTSDFGDPAVSRQKIAEGDGAAEEISTPWNQQLQEELSSHGLQDRVKYVRSLASLAQHVSALYGPVAAEELDLLTKAINLDLLANMLNKEIMTLTVPARDVALEPTVSVAEVNEVLSTDLEWKFSDAANSGEKDWTANYVVDLEAVVLGFSSDLSEMLSIDTKVLRVSGTVKFSNVGRLQEFEIARIEALPDDPNRGLWDLFDQAGFGESSGVGTYLATQFRSGVTLPPHIIDSITKLGGLSNITMPPHIIDSMTKLGGLSNITMPPHIIDSMTKLGGLSNITMPPHIIDSMTKLGEQALVDEDDPDVQGHREDTNP